MVNRPHESPARGRTRPRWPIAVCVALAAIAGAVAPQPGEASLSVRPAIIEMTLGQKERPSETITITNITDAEARYRLHVVHFLYTEDGSLQMVEPDERSLAPWIKCNPREFQLAPKETRAVRLSILPPTTLAGGEYWAAVWFEPLTGRIESADDGKGHKMTLKVTTNIIVPIVGTVPSPTYDCRLEDLGASKNGDGINITARVSNRGSGRVKLKGSYEVLDASEALVAEGLIGDDTVLAGGSRTFHQNVKGEFGQGDYTVRVRYESEKLSDVLAGQTRVAAQ